MTVQKVARKGAYPILELVTLPVAAGTAILEEGNDIATDANGYAVLATAATAVRVWGKAVRTIDASSLSSPTTIEVKLGNFYYSNGSGVNAFSRADIGSRVYFASGAAMKSDGGGLYPFLGTMMPGDGTDGLGIGPDSGKVLVLVGGDQSNVALAGSTANVARVVATSLAAFTQTTGAILADANGAIGTQDGVTLAVGDIIFLPKGTVGSATVANADEGPWQLTAVGGASAKYAAVRPAWYRHGSEIPSGFVVQIGGEGTLFGATQWKATSAASLVVGTGAAAFYPGIVTQAVTLVAGTVTISNVPIRSATKTAVVINRTTANTSTATTGGYHPSTITPGALGTASLVVQAQVAAGTINNADISTLNVGIVNW